MAYVLKSARGKKQGLAIPIRTKVFLIGSSAKSQIRSRKAGVGRRHCALFLRKKQLYLQDLESGHPTRVNGLTVTPGARLVLKMGDSVAMGPMEFIIEQRHRATSLQRAFSLLRISAIAAACPSDLLLSRQSRP